MKTFLKWLAVILSVFIILIIAVVFLLNSLLDSEPAVANNSYLHIHISGELPEYVPPDPLEDFFGRASLDMKKIRDDLEKAAVDDRINGVILQINFLQTGYAKLQELHVLIDEYKKSGKKIFAYLETPMTKEYYLATACDSIFMPPSGNLFITGLNSEIMFYKGLFEKFGIEAEFIQIGKYKNAPDPYTRSTMSPDQKEVLGAILDEYFEDIIQTISLKRSISAGDVYKLMNETSGFTAKEALQIGLIDGTAFYSEVREKLKTGVKNPTKVSATRYAAVPASSLKIRNKSKIAVINCSGTIASGGDGDDPVFGKVMGSSTIVSELEKAAAAGSVKAIILRIDSPGGSATASEIIWAAIVKAAEKKPVIASISDYGASGGFYIAMGADSVIANPASLVGSIGIFAGKFNVTGLYKKLDLNIEQLRRGKNAGLFSIMKPWSESERAIVYKLINSFYTDFVGMVSAARGISYEKTESLAQGHVWTGSQAFKNGLIDKTGSFYTAIDAAKKMSGIPEDESVRLVYYPKEKSLFYQLFDVISVKNRSYIGQIEYLLEHLGKIQNQPLAIMPFLVEWN